jgi:hypothetical protein
MTEQQSPSTSLREAGRLAGIFWEPRPVFQDLAARPRFWVPLIILTVLSVAYLVSYSRVVGFENMIRRQIEVNPRTAQLPPEQRERAMEMGLKIAVPMAYVSGVLAFAVSALVIAGILLGSVNLLGGAKVRYRQAFSITCYSFLPSGLATILAMVVMFMKDPADFDLQHPLPLNLAAVLDKSAVGNFVYSLAGSLDLFSIWVMLLLALGFSTAAGKMSFGKAFMLVVVPWAVFVLLKSSWAALTGSAA